MPSTTRLMMMLVAILIALLPAAAATATTTGSFQQLLQQQQQQQAVPTSKKELVNIWICNDTVRCDPSTCHLLQLPGDSCYVTGEDNAFNSCVWNCSDVTIGDCFRLVAYKAGSGCSGPALDSRPNHCDECKPPGVNKEISKGIAQHRRCIYENPSAGPNSRAKDRGPIEKVEFWNCSYLDGFCTGNCSATPDRSFGYNECVENYQGYDWRLEAQQANCHLMYHACWHNTECTPQRGKWFHDRIVLDHCSWGYQFVCPNVDRGGGGGGGFESFLSSSKSSQQP